MSKFLLLLCIGLLTAQSAFARKRAEMEELESILDDIDDTKKARDLSNSRHNAASGSADADREAARESAAICANHVCGWGKTCVAVKGRPVCECVSQCPDDGNDPLAQVCASNNQTYGSLCELYRQRCVCKRRNGYESECHSPANSKIHLEYLGACKELDHCTPELMTQFPERMSDWLFQVMKELKKRRELHGVEWEELISEAEGDDKKKHVYPVIWKFCDLDIKPHDKHVSHHELIPITAPVIPMESCIKPFLENCDTDKNGSITIQEWGICLGLKEGEIQERC